MPTALRLTACVQAGHRIEITTPELAEGEEVTVLVTSPGTLAPSAPEARAGHLLAQGAIPAIPTGRSGPPPRPITVRGRLMSETIIEERG